MPTRGNLVETEWFLSYFRHPEQNDYVYVRSPSDLRLHRLLWTPLDKSRHRYWYILRCQVLSVRERGWSPLSSSFQTYKAPEKVTSHKYRNGQGNYKKKKPKKHPSDQRNWADSEYARGVGGGGTPLSWSLKHSKKTQIQVTHYYSWRLLADVGQAALNCSHAELYFSCTIKQTHLAQSFYFCRIMMAAGIYNYMHDIP